MLSTVTFVQHSGKTTVTIRWMPINASESERATCDAAHKDMQNGRTGTLGQLAAYLQA
jgi:hypothetical protein